LSDSFELELSKRKRSERPSSKFVFAPPPQAADPFSWNQLQYSIPAHDERFQIGEHKYILHAKSPVYFAARSLRPANGTAVPIFIDTETSRPVVFLFVRVQLDSSCRSLKSGVLDSTSLRSLKASRRPRFVTTSSQGSQRTCSHDFHPGPSPPFLPPRVPGENLEAYYRC